MRKPSFTHLTNCQENALENTQALPEDDPHAWPSVYEPTPFPSTPNDANGASATDAPPRPRAAEVAPAALNDASARRDEEDDFAEKRLGAPPAVAPPDDTRPTDGSAPSGHAPAAKRAYGRKSLAVASSPAKALPHPNDLDMFPAFMSRSALFGAFRSNCGGTHAGPLKAAEKVPLTFEGQRLSMADKRVWEALARIAKRDGVDISQPFKARLAEVADMAGYGPGQSRSAWSAIERLSGSKIDATVRGAKVSGWLLMSAVRDKRDALVRLDPALVGPALSQTMLASMAGAARDGVKSPLGQWLRDYFSTHEPTTKPLTLDYLRELSGYPSPPKRFVAALEAAMAELAAKRPDLIASWSINTGAADSNASARWVLLAIRGPAAPALKHPPKAVPASAPATAPAPKKRGGPNL